jgi:hypothetical protein
MPETPRNQARSANWFFGPGGGAVGDPNAIGMPGSEVYPPAPAGNQPYDPVRAYVQQQIQSKMAPFLLPHDVLYSQTPVSTAQMYGPALGLAALARLGTPPPEMARSAPFISKVVKTGEEKAWDKAKDMATESNQPVSMFPPWLREQRA